MSVQFHPRRDDAGRAVPIHRPTLPTPPASWADPATIAVFVPEGCCPAELNGVRFAEKALAEGAAFDALAGSDAADPPLPPLRPGLRRSAGAVVQEPDGRVWVFEPTNHFGGTQATFPKGRLEPGDTPRAAAVREVREETGLLVTLGACLGDIARSTTQVRYYLAKRVAGTPVAMGWECQAMWLVPLARLTDVMHGPAEEPVVRLVRQRLLTQSCCVPPPAGGCLSGSSCR